MDAIQRLFGANPQRGQLPKVDSDDVYPASLLDDTQLFRDMILTWTFCFNDVLDPDKLHSSLTRLLEIGDWRKLGGRLRLNVLCLCGARTLYSDRFVRRMIDSRSTSRGSSLRIDQL